MKFRKRLREINRGGIIDMAQHPEVIETRKRGFAERFREIVNSGKGRPGNGMRTQEEQENEVGADHSMGAETISGEGKHIRGCNYKTEDARRS